MAVTELTGRSFFASDSLHKAYKTYSGVLIFLCVKTDGRICHYDANNGLNTGPTCL